MTLTRVHGPEALGIEEPRGWRNAGARACAAGHRLAWRQAWRGGAEAALVFEDDVILGEGFKARLDALQLPEDWAGCYLGCVFRERPVMVQQGLLRVGATFDMHAYLIRKTFAKVLGPALGGPSQRKCGEKERPWPRTAIDVILSDHHRVHAAYAVWPPMAWQVEGLSNNEHAFRGN